LFQLLQTLKLDSFLPFLIVSYALKELHQFLVFFNLLRLIEYGGRIYTKFPVELLDTFFNLLSTVLYDDLIIFNPPEVLHERLVIKHFGFINYHVVKIHVLKVHFSQIVTELNFAYRSNWMPVIGEDTFVIMDIIREAESELLIFSPRNSLNS